MSACGVGSTACPREPRPLPAVPLRLLPLLVARMRGDRLGVLDRIRDEVGPLARLPLLGIVFVAEAGAAREILGDTQAFPDKGIGLRAARHYLDDGRLTATGAEWAASHRRASPFYTSGATARSIAGAVRALERQLHDVDRGPFMLQPCVDRAIVTGLLSHLLGEEQALAADPAPILRDLRILTAWNHRQLGAKPAGAAHLSWLLSGTVRQADARLHTAIRAWRQRARGGTLAGLSGLDDESAHTETITLLVAAFETSSAAMAFAVDALSRSPEFAARVANDRGDSPTARRAVLETLRLHPPVWAITRRAARDLAIAGYSIRARDQLVISIHGLHRDPKIWHEPSRFDPDRFAEGAPPSAFMPFGIGPRQCVGRQAGIGEVSALIAWLFQRYRIEPVDPPSAVRAGLAQMPGRPGRYALSPR